MQIYKGAIGLEIDANRCEIWDYKADLSGKPPRSKETRAENRFKAILGLKDCLREVVDFLVSKVKSDPPVAR